MPSFCAEVNCGMRGNRDNVRFFRISASLKNAGDQTNALSNHRQEMWIKALSPLSESQIKYGRICSRHFKTGAPAELLDNDHPNWVPNQNMGYVIPHGVGDTQINRFKRSRKKRKQFDELETGAHNILNIIVHRSISSRMSSIEQQQHVQVLENEAIPGTSRNSDEYENMETQKNEATQTDLTVDNVTKIIEEFSLLNHRVYTLEQKLENLEIHEETFKNDDTKTVYYTGLPKAEMLFILFEKNKDYFLYIPIKYFPHFSNLY